MKSIKQFINESNDITDKLDKFLYDMSWHESVGFESTEECNFIIDNLQSKYNFKLTKSYDNRRKTSTVILKGKTPKEKINVTLEFYPNGDEYNDEPWCDLRDTK